jgi:hypothetical protein
MIVKSGDAWLVKDADRILGSYPTREEAQRQLRALADAAAGNRRAAAERGAA